MSKISNYLENVIINHFLRKTPTSSPSAVYLALYTSDPTDADTGTEVSGGSYERQAITFSAPSNGSTSNSSTITFPTATGNWGTLTHVGIRDDSSGGNLLFYGPLATSKTITTGDQFIVNSGNLTVTID